MFENLSDTIESSQEIITGKITQSNKELADIISGIGTVIEQLKTAFKEADKQINDSTKKNNHTNAVSFYLSLFSWFSLFFSELPIFCLTVHR